MASYTVYHQQGNSASYYVSSTVQGNPAGSRPVPCNFSENQKKYLNGEAKALGVVQIMIGILNILLGIILFSSLSFAFSHTGILFWGGIFYIISGSLSVASDRYQKSLINGNLAMNIISSISSGIGIILCGIHLIIFMDFYDRYYSYGSQLENGVVGVLLVFLLLELCVAISSAAFSCKVLCCNDTPMTAGQQCDIQLTQHEVASASAPNYPTTPQQMTYNIPPPPPYLPYECFHQKLTP
ncbi:membrane-spanning 4-domains subfamily A member 4A-like isoform X1 [Polypterus senegalus]|uniref:membrane-spanning 4-domains subfamily A member 4A-like isoform X1 n=1 Tax=Polypterus senegalus TaxID=55291 RepID=UPI0019631006|nr:membrane-spanning 4-domains subfamily A member 4A-like isoform X1 [Polypterus senegalus]